MLRIVAVTLLALAACGGHADTGQHYVFVRVDPNLPATDTTELPPTDDSLPMQPPIGGGEGDAGADPDALAEAGVTIDADVPSDASADAATGAAPPACCQNLGTPFYCTRAAACPDYYRCGDADVFGLPDGSSVCD